VAGIYWRPNKNNILIIDKASKLENKVYFLIILGKPSNAS
jgi:hypothetical protein